MLWNEDAIFVDNDPWAIQLSDDARFDDNGVFQSGTLSNATPPEWSPNSPGIPFGADIRVSARNSVTTDYAAGWSFGGNGVTSGRSEEHTSELQSRGQLVCRLLLEKKKQKPLKRVLYIEILCK